MLTGSRKSRGTRSTGDRCSGKGNEAWLRRAAVATRSATSSTPMPSEQAGLRADAERTGAFVAPDDDAFKAAAAGADWKKSFYQILTNQRARTPGDHRRDLHHDARQAGQAAAGPGRAQVLRLGVRSATRCPRNSTTSAPARGRDMVRQSWARSPAVTASPSRTSSTQVIRGPPTRPAGITPPPA